MLALISDQLLNIWLLLIGFSGGSLLLGSDDIVSCFFLNTLVDCGKVTLIFSSNSIERIVVELEECANSFVAGHLIKFNLTQLARSRRLWHLLDLQLVIGALDLAERDAACRCCKN